MTLILDLDLDVLKMYLCTKNQVFRSIFQKLEPEQDIQNVFCPCDLDHYQMTLIFDLDLDLLKAYVRTKMNSRSRLSNQTHREGFRTHSHTHTDRRDRTLYHAPLKHL